MNRLFRAAPVAGVIALFAASLPVSAALTLLPRAAFAQAPVPVAGAVRGQATWDARYLYVLLVVDDPDVQGTNTLPLSEPQKDDSVAVYVQTGDAKPDAPNAQTHAMLVSAAGGFAFLAGDDATKTLAPKPVYSIKYGVSVQGTLNRSDDTDRGYTVELAIPWNELGIAEGAVKAGMPVSINVVVRDRAGRSFAALAPDIKVVGDLESPAKWLPLVIAASESADIPAGAVFAPPAPKKGDRVTPPAIDGVLRVAGEWPAAGKFTLAAPTSAKPAPIAVEAVPVTVAPPEDNTPPALTLTAESLAGLEPLVFARYRLDFQGDGRKITPFTNTFDGRTGKFLLADEPLTGAGPWFSSDRAAWHRGLLYEMRRTGVDVALVSVGTGAADYKALYVLVEALREMTQDGLPTPKIALELSTSRLTPEGVPEDGVEGLYAGIARFFGTVPPQFRARVTLPVRAGGVPVYPVFFRQPANPSGVFISNIDQKDRQGTGWTDALRKSFATEFGASSGGAGLVFVGGDGFNAATSPGLVAGGVPLLAGGAGTGALPVYVVQPGREPGMEMKSTDSDGKKPDGTPMELFLAPTPPDDLIARKDGETYQKAWEAALAAKPKWYVLDSWNDFLRGTELVGSRQYGTRFLDATRIFTAQTGKADGIDLRWRESNVPRRMRIGQTVPITVSVQNGGGIALRPEDGYVLSYRWMQNGKTVAEAPLRNRLNEPFLPTQTRTFLVGVASLMLDGSGKLAPLPPGDYALEIDFLKLKNPADLLGAGDYLAQSSVAPLVVPVSLYADNRQSAIFESTTTPALLQAGSSYPVTVSVRYMGADDLGAGTAALTWQLVTVDNKTVAASGSSPINDILPSGVPVPVQATITLNDATGLPVSPAFPELPPDRGTPGGGYKLRWLLTRTDSTDAVPGELLEQVAVYAGDEEARFPLPDAVPESVTADTTFTLNIPVVNRGASPWKVGDYRVGAHWYYSDGLEAQWKPALTAALPKDVAPGEEITVKLPIRAPEMDGAYIVVPDIVRLPEDYLSTRPVSRIGDIAPIYLRVTGGRLAFVDLAALFNTDAVATESNPADGDLDDRGATFPAESFPPDRYGLGAPPEPALAKPDADGKRKSAKTLPAPPYPSGYYADFSPSARRIAFRYGATGDGAKNAVACAGQVISVPKGNYGGLHFAATATGGQTETLSLLLTYADKTTQTVSVTVRDWNAPQAPTGDTIATMTQRKRTPTGDAATACYLRHVIAPANVAKQMVSVTLPDNPKVKVFALTLDK